MSTRRMMAKKVLGVPLLSALSLVALQVAVTPTAQALEPGSIGDRVWHDVDVDGIQDDWEPGVPDVLVTVVDSEGYGTSTFTDSDGRYELSNLPVGTYTVHFTLPDGASFTTQGNGDNRDKDSDPNPAVGSTDPVELTAQQPKVTNIDAGLVMEGGPAPQVGSIGDYVWHDANVNGIQDAGERGLSGAEVMLYNASGQLIDRTISNADGFYKFGDLDYGTYTIRVADFRGGWVLTRARQGSDRTRDSDLDPSTGRSLAIRVDGNQPNVTSVDIGFIRQQR